MWYEVNVRYKINLYVWATHKRNSVVVSLILDSSFQADMKITWTLENGWVFFLQNWVYHNFYRSLQYTHPCICFVFIAKGSMNSTLVVHHLVSMDTIKVKYCISINSTEIKGMKHFVGIVIQFHRYVVLYQGIQHFFHIKSL